MDEKTKNKILKEALFTFGIDAQIDMAIEEMSELTKALCKYKRSAKKYQGLQTHPLGVFDNVREEIADVEEDVESLNKLLDWWTQTPYDHYHQWLSETYDALKKSGKA